VVAVRELKWLRPPELVALDRQPNTWTAPSPSLPTRRATASSDEEETRTIGSYPRLAERWDSLAATPGSWTRRPGRATCRGATHPPPARGPFARRTRRCFRQMGGELRRVPRLAAYWLERNGLRGEPRPRAHRPPSKFNPSTTSPTTGPHGSCTLGTSTVLPTGGNPGPDRQRAPVQRAGAASLTVGARAVRPLRLDGQSRALGRASERRRAGGREALAPRRDHSAPSG
jgi:hypothetical protein